MKAHPILEGKSSDEKVDVVLTFTGQAAQITGNWEPLMEFGPAAIAIINPQQTFQNRLPVEGIPSFSIAGWTHAAARQMEKGRVVFLGEAAMCTAQLMAVQSSIDFVIVMFFR